MSERFPSRSLSLSLSTSDSDQQTHVKILGTLYSSPDDQQPGRSASPALLLIGKVRKSCPPWRRDCSQLCAKDGFCVSVAREPGRRVGQRHRRRPGATASQKPLLLRTVVIVSQARRAASHPPAGRHSRPRGKWAPPSGRAARRAAPASRAAARARCRASAGQVTPPAGGGGGSRLVARRGALAALGEPLPRRLPFTPSLFPPLPHMSAKKAGVLPPHTRRPGGKIKAPEQVSGQLPPLILSQLAGNGLSCRFRPGGRIVPYPPARKTALMAVSGQISPYYSNRRKAALMSLSPSSSIS